MKIRNLGVWSKATARNPDSLVVSGIDTSGGGRGGLWSTFKCGPPRGCGFFTGTALIPSGLGLWYLSGPHCYHFECTGINEPQHIVYVNASSATTALSLTVKLVSDVN